MIQITPYNLLHHELIGLKINVVSATHKGYMTAGRIVDETKNTLKIKDNHKEITVPKNCTIFDLTLPEGTQVRVDGKLLIVRPEERIKKRYRIKFV